MEDIEEQLSKVLKNVPEIETRPDNFFDILGVQTKETYISKAYDYFLNSSNREIASLFLNSLAELIKLKSGKDFFFEDFYSETEVMTEKEGRIDIVISSREDAERKIIIENKVSAKVYNDLVEYWDNFKIPKENKVGILLTLNSIGDMGNFINITHREWMEEINRNGLPVGLPTQFYVYVNDFISNIQKITTMQKFSERVKFFFQNSEEIINAIKLKDEGKFYIDKQIEQAALNLSMVYKCKKGNFAYIQPTEKSDVFYTIAYDKLFERTKKLSIVIEFWWEKNIAKSREVDGYLHGNGVNLEGFIHKNANKPHNWLHYLTKDYTLSLKDIENLEGFIVEKISSDFQSIMKLILEFFEPTPQQTTV